MDSINKIDYYYDCCIIKPHQVCLTGRSRYGVNCGGVEGGDGERPIRFNQCQVVADPVQCQAYSTLPQRKDKQNVAYPNVSDICDRCNLSKRTLGQFCPKIVPFWLDICTWYCKLYELQIEPDALPCLVALMLLLHCHILHSRPLCLVCQ